MKRFQLAIAAIVFMGNTAFAGGILTNTNQSISFLRNPARDAAIGLDGVYSNPAGVAFLNEGFHLGINWQYAHQTRTVTSTNPVFALGRKNHGATTKEFQGVADAPFIPSLQAAYNKGNWSWQFNFSVPGGGGKCEFKDGLGSFESTVGTIAHQLSSFGATGYDMDSYMEGRQYYYGIQLGAAYKVKENLSVYGGIRFLYGDATYRAKLNNIMVNTAGGYVDFGGFLQSATVTVDGRLSQVNAGIAQYQDAGVEIPAELAETKAKLEGARTSLNSLQKYSQGVNLLCNQTSMGFAPVIGIDYKIGRFNLAAKYEFKTQIRMKNESTVNEASEIEAVNKFRDAEDVNEDMPALLTLGAQWTPVDDVRLNVGFHHYFDKKADWYNESQSKLSHDSYEILAGAEWDVNEKLTISAGGQITRYGLTDDYMNDMSFVVNSYSVGFGFEYKVSERVKLSAAYFQTNYDHYDRTTSKEPLISDSFTRTNQVVGVGCELTF